jgi:ABC-type multidrug transport system fused ATPase/permease subunit
MVVAKMRYQSERSDPGVVALWYAAFILGYPIRVLLNLVVPLPNEKTLRVLRRSTQTAAICMLASLVGLILLVALLLLLGMLSMIWPAIKNATDFNVLPIWVTLLAILFRGMVVMTGLQGYVKNYPSEQSDD